MSVTSTMGPVQMLVVTFDRGQFQGEILPELERLREQDIVRLIDLLVVARDESGDISALHRSDLSPLEAERFGAIVGALIGLGAGGGAGAEIGSAAGAEAMRGGVRLDDDTVWDVAEHIPVGSTAAIALIEHRWAIALRDAIVRAGAVSVADVWLHPTDLVAIGLQAAGTVPVNPTPAPG